MANAVLAHGLKEKLYKANISNIVPLLAQPGLLRTNLLVTTAEDGEMHAKSEFMNEARSTQDVTTAIIREAMDLDAKSRNPCSQAERKRFEFYRYISV